MSSIGKIFVIVNLLLAVLVLGAAGALLKRTDVTADQMKAAQDRLEAAQTELDQARSDFTERERALTADKQRLQEERDDMQVAHQTLQNSATSLEADNQQLRDDVTKINSTLTALETSFSSTQQRVAELTDQNAQLRDQMMEARTAANDAEAARLQATTAQGDAERRIAELEETSSGLQAELHTASKLLEVAKAGGFDPTTIMAMPRIEATVAEVDEQYGFVILDKGKDDNVERGFTFEVYRDGQYLGRVKVDETFANYATARIELRTPGTKMQRYDRASTYLN
jgi:predicted  nucleic acid-binding Zn-ribbon protein